MTESLIGPNAKGDEFGKLPTLTIAHGTLMGLSFAIIFPLGSLFIRLIKSKYALPVHIACQLIGWICMIVGLSMGVQLADILDIYGQPHTVFGSVVVAALFLQPAFGYIHHRFFKKKHRQTVWTTLHVWYGRILILLGIINGGCGILLVKGSPFYSKAGTVSYAVLTALSGTMILGLIALGIRRKRLETTKQTQNGGHELSGVKATDKPHSPPPSS